MIQSTEGFQSEERIMKEINMPSDIVTNTKHDQISPIWRDDRSGDFQWARFRVIIYARSSFTQGFESKSLDD